MYYSKPVYGRAYKPFSSEMVDVTAENIGQWSFKKVITWKRRIFAMFKNAEGGEIMQSLQAIRFVRCKPGEENYMAKLTDAQSIDIFQRATKGESQEALATEFKVAKGTIGDIKNMRTRARITLNFLNGTTKKAQVAAAIVAKRNKGKKLSASMATFIRRDNTVSHLTTAQLAIKYCVTKRTIQRILKGDMYK